MKIRYCIAAVPLARIRRRLLGSGETRKKVRKEGRRQVLLMTLTQQTYVQDGEERFCTVVKFC